MIRVWSYVMQSIKGKISAVSVSYPATWVGLSPSLEYTLNYTIIILILWGRRGKSTLQGSLILVHRSWLFEVGILRGWRSINQPGCQWSAVCWVPPALQVYMLQNRVDIHGAWVKMVLWNGFILLLQATFFWKAGWALTKGPCGTVCDVSRVGTFANTQSSTYAAAPWYG